MLSEINRSDYFVKCLGYFMCSPFVILSYNTIIILAENNDLDVDKFLIGKFELKINCWDLLFYYNINYILDSFCMYFFVMYFSKYTVLTEDHKSYYNTIFKIYLFYSFFSFLLACSNLIFTFSEIPEEHGRFRTWFIATQYFSLIRYFFCIIITIISKIFNRLERDLETV